MSDQIYGFVRRASDRPVFTCPSCRRTSNHPKDIEYRYCANCHQFVKPTHALVDKLINDGVPMARIAQAIKQLSEE